MCQALGLIPCIAGRCSLFQPKSQSLFDDWLGASEGCSGQVRHLPWECPDVCLPGATSLSGLLKQLVPSVMLQYLRRLLPVSVLPNSRTQLLCMPPWAATAEIWSIITNLPGNIQEWRNPLYQPDTRGKTRLGNWGPLPFWWTNSALSEGERLLARGACVFPLGVLALFGRVG